MQVARAIVREDNLFDGDLENLSEDVALEDGEKLSRKGVFLPRSWSSCLPEAKLEALLKRLVLSLETFLEGAGWPCCTVASPLVKEYRDHARFPSMNNLRAGER